MYSVNQALFGRAKFKGAVMYRGLILMVLLILGGPAYGQYEAYGTISAQRQRAAMIYNRLTGQKIPIDSQVLKDMETLIKQGNDMAAARLATDQPAFYTQTLLYFGNRFSNAPGSNRAPMTDASATVIGFAKDNLDARDLLTSKFLYRFQSIPNIRANVLNDIVNSNNHYDDVDTVLAGNPGFDIRPNLVQADQQIATDANALVNHPDAAGIISSRAFLSDCADGGTNRRCYQKVVERLTCHTLEEVANSSLPDTHVGRDVSRAPGGDPQAYQVTCKSCHSSMDGIRGAFAFTEFDSNRVKHGQVNGGSLFSNTTGVAVKMNRLGDGNYSQVAPSTTDAWVNYAVGGELGNLYGWRNANGDRITDPVSSSGLNAYGRMIGRSEAFSRCVVRTAFENVCKRVMSSEEKAGLLRDLASEWEKPAAGNYKIRWLFEKVAVSPACTGN